MEEQSLHCDLMFVEGEPYLISVSTPLGLTMCTHLASGKGAESVKKAMFDQIAAYESERFVIRTILSDLEGSISSIRAELNQRGIRVNPSGPGQHVPVVERKIQQVKERVRAHLSTMPYLMNTVLLKWLVYYCISRINCIPSSTNQARISPRELFYGRKLDAKRDVRIGFGEYVQCVTPNLIKNSMSPRTEGAISLLPVGNLQGSVKFFSLATGKIIVRDKWTVLPMPQSVIEHLNLMCGNQKQKVRSDPTFSMSHPGGVIRELQMVQLDDEFYRLEPMRTVTNEQVQARDQRTSEADQDDIEEVIIQDADEAASPSQPAMEKHEQVEVIKEPNHIAQQQDTADPQTPEPEPTVATEEPEAIPDKPQDVQSQQQPTYPCRYNLRERRAQPGRWSQKPPKTEYGLHVTATKAIRSYGKEAIKAMLLELEQMLQKEVWKPIDVSTLSPAERKSVIITSMFLKEKQRPDGSFDKLKARLVAGGHMQDRSIYEDISSPTVSWTSVCLILGIAATERRHVCTADFTGAYLNASMKDSGAKVRVRLNLLQSTLLISLDASYERYACHDGTIVVELKKAMYGCIESAQLWYETLRDNLIEIGFKANAEDPCVFNLNRDGVQCTVAVYVDDLLITCASQNVIEWVIAQVSSRFPDVKVTSGKKHSYLGVSVDLTTTGKVKLSMLGYIRDVLNLFEVSKRALTPATENLYQVRDSPLLSLHQREVFHSRVAKLLYLAKKVRPNILTAVSFLTTRVQGPTEDDWEKLQRCLSYLNGEPGLVLTLECTDGVNFSSYFDAAYGVHIDGKSQSGSNHTMGKGSFLAKSKKQKIVAKSSTEGELISASDNVPDVVSIRRFLKEQGYSLKPTVVYQDNMSTMALIAKGRSTSEKSKHIKIRYFFIKQHVDDGEIQIVHMPTDDMLADLLTKPLQGTKFRDLRRRLMNLVE